MFSYDSDTASLIAGSIYDVSLVLVPIVGALIDYLGFRCIICSLAQIFTIPVFVLLAYNDTIDILPLLIWYGITYSLAVSVYWSCIPLLVSPSFVGTAMGFASSLQMLWIGSSNTIVG